MAHENATPLDRRSQLPPRALAALRVAIYFRAHYPLARPLMTDLNSAFARLEASPRMPALFVGHGNPMNAIEDNAYSRGWRALGEKLPKPHAHPLRFRALDDAQAARSCISASGRRRSTISAAFRASSISSNIRRRARPTSLRRRSTSCARATSKPTANGASTTAPGRC